MYNQVKLVLFLLIILYWLMLYITIHFYEIIVFLHHDHTNIKKILITKRIKIFNNLNCGQKFI